MSNSLQLKKHKWKLAGSFAVCAALAILSEWHEFHFIYGISFSLSGLFTLLALRLFGFWKGLLTALVAFAAGAFLFHHSLLHLICLLEAVVVGILLRRYKGRLLASDAAFWLLIGMPLTYVMVSSQYADGPLEVKLIAFILAVNGLFNALFAEIAHQYLPLRRWSGLSSIKRMPSSINQLLLHLTLGIVLGSFLLNMTTNNMSSFKEVSLYANEISKRVVETVVKEWSAAEGLLTVPASSGRIDKLQLIIDRYSSASYKLSFVDHHDRILASNKHELIGALYNPWIDRQVTALSESLYLTAQSDNDSPFYLRTWQTEHFLYRESLYNWEGHMLVETPVGNYSNYLFNKYYIQFVYFAVFAAIAAGVALLINRSIARSLQRLAVSTRNMTVKLKQHNELVLPQSSILEIHTLISNFRHMANSLLHLFTESQNSNRQLETHARLLRRSEERLHQLAYYDTLTGLPNRLQFTRHLHSMITMGAGRDPSRRPIAILFTDINRFKQVNDTLGHSSGDRLLQLVAERFRGLTSRQCEVFRLGGDEFVFVRTFEDDAELRLAAQSVCDCFIEPFIIDDMPLYLTASVGISVHPQDGEDMDTIIRNADIAMYSAKEEGDGCFRFFQSNLVPAIAEKMRLENGLYKALQEKQFSLHYQPKMSAESGELCGIEALIRWEHPELGMIPPDKFIPLAEESGLIMEIDSWVFREACRQNKAWQDAGLKRICVSVNISARHFYQGNLKEMVVNHLQETGLDPQYVSLEITEGVFMRNIDQVIETILYLRALGIQISIDDFGTGYSSLNQLQRLPISDVKLDRSFIRGITQDEKKSSIVKAIIELVHSMNMKVVAEGVETADESQFCKELQCDELQGYLFSRPLPPGLLEKLLVEDERRNPA